MVVAEVALLIVLMIYLAWAVQYVHPKRDRRAMDFWDAARRRGPSVVYLTIAAASLLLVLDVGPEWRLPPLTLASIYVALGLTRDVRREHDKRRKTP